MKKKIIKQRIIKETPNISRKSRGMRIFDAVLFSAAFVVLGMVFMPQFFAKNPSNSSAIASSSADGVFLLNSGLDAEITNGIVFDGNNYLTENTPISTDGGYDMDFQLNGTGAPNNWSSMVKWGNGGAYYAALGTDPGNTRFILGAGLSAAGSPSPLAGSASGTLNTARHTAEVSNTTSTFDGIISGRGGGSNNNDNKLQIGSAGWTSSYIIFSFQGSDSTGAATIKLLPAVQCDFANSAIRYGFYDSVNNQFLIQDIGDNLSSTTALNYASYCRSYDVNFNSMGGSPAPSIQIFNYRADLPDSTAAPSVPYAADDETFTYNQTATNPGSPAATGYTFQNWYSCTVAPTSNFANLSNVSGCAIYDFTANVSSDVNLYASWTANTYEISFNGYGSSSGNMTNQNMTYGTATNLAANTFSRTGYTFAGWSTSAGGTVVYTDQQSVLNLSADQGAVINLYAVWNINTYTVHYDANMSSCVDSNGNPNDMTNTSALPADTTVVYGEQFTVGGNILDKSPGGPTCVLESWSLLIGGGNLRYDFLPGQTVDSWIINEFGSNLTFYAQWEPLSLTFTLNNPIVSLDGGVGFSKERITFSANTNNPLGYTISSGINISNPYGYTNALVETSNPNFTIPAAVGESANFDTLTSPNSWGYCDSFDYPDTYCVGFPAAGTSRIITSSANAGGKAYAIEIAQNTGSTQAEGIYQNQLLYTVVANP